MKVVHLLWFLANFLVYLGAIAPLLGMAAVVIGQSMEVDNPGVLAVVLVLTGQAVTLLLAALRIGAWVKCKTVYTPATFSGTRLILSVALAVLFVSGILIAPLLVFPLLGFYVTSVFVLMCCVEWPDLYRALATKSFPAA